jgi:tetraacyldisaccharide 4'-kinase
MGFVVNQYLALVAERRRGLLYDLLRALLAVIAVPYAAIIILRNAYYDLYPGASTRVDRPVISVGNLTVGGTGKTPIAADIANRLLQRRGRVAILTRGYGSRPRAADDARSGDSHRWRGGSDEAMVLQRRAPKATVIIHPDRVASARRAIDGGAEAIVLDDGFQHRRLARDLDVVLVDAGRPFGHGHILPRGLLREPASSLVRAGLIIVTRSTEVDSATRSMLLATLRRVSRGKPIIESNHRIDGFADLKGRPVEIEDPSDVQAVLFAGIANFESLRRSVEKLGVNVLAAYQYPDHHDYLDVEIQGLIDVAGDLEANAILTTEKDAVKLLGRWPDAGCRLLVVNLKIEFLDRGEGVLDNVLDDVLARFGNPTTPDRAVARSSAEDEADTPLERASNQV